MGATSERFPEIVGERAHVGAAAHREIEGEVRQRPGVRGEVIDPDAALLRLRSLAPARRHVQPLAADFHSRIEGRTLPRQVAPEPKELGQVLTDLHKKPGQLRDMLGGGDVQPRGQALESNPIGDILASPMAKAVLAGIAAMVVKRVMGRSPTA